MTLPVTPVTLPSSLVGQPNGGIDPSLMVAIHTRGSLHKTTARAWRALVAACGTQGLPLTFTYGGCYRTYAEQEQLFRSRYTTTFIDGASRKWWQGMWWYLKPGLAMAAVPGTSNHGLGLAIDTAFDKDPSDGLGPDDAASIAGHPKFAWFRDNVARFGFSFEAQSEPWHIRYFAGDAVPQAVLDFEKGILSSPSAPAWDPANGKFGLWPFASKPAAKLGDTGDRVKYLQGVLKCKCGYPVTVDGNFGTQTETYVKQFQAANGLVADGWIGSVGWPIVDRKALS